MSGNQSTSRLKNAHRGLAGRRRGALPAPVHRLQGAGRTRARASSRAPTTSTCGTATATRSSTRCRACGASTSATASSALIDAATRQMSELPFYNAFFQTATPPAIELAELLAEVTPPQFQHVFFSGSGSEGNDTVVRMVRRYWDILGQPERQVIISRAQRLPRLDHGRRLARRHERHARAGRPADPRHRAHRAAVLVRERAREHVAARSSAWSRRALAGGEDPRGRRRQGGRLHRRAGAGRRRRDRAARATYWPEIQRICDKYGILLVSDEVICGFGRTGHWFGCERFGFRPDLMTFAKGVTSGYIPLGGVMVGERVAKVLIDAGRRVQPRLHLLRPPGGLRGGAGQHPADPAAENLVERVRDDVGPYLADDFDALATTRWSARRRPAA